MDKLSILLLLVGVCFGISSAQNYCNIKSCGKEAHTACIHTSNKPAAACSNYVQVGVTDEEKTKIVDVHNKFRQRVARGEEKFGNPGPQPAAKNMPNLEWDDELAMIAQKWANQCNFTYDSCRDVERFSVGQNLALEVSVKDFSEFEIDYMIKTSWYNEVSKFNKNEVAKFTRTVTPAGHYIGDYTHIVWGKTTKIGCGIIKYTPQKGYNYIYLACNYGPAGNILGEPVYETA